VRNEHKKTGRVNLIRHLLREVHPDGLKVEAPDPKIVFRYEPSALTDGRLAP
jgi:hypothetical protein